MANAVEAQEKQAGANPGVRDEKGRADEEMSALREQAQSRPAPPSPGHAVSQEALKLAGLSAEQAQELDGDSDGTVTQTEWKARTPSPRPTYMSTG